MQPPAPRNRPARCSCTAEKQIVLIGASVRAAAQSASRAGFCVTGIDLFCDSDTEAACHQLFAVPGMSHSNAGDGDPDAFGPVGLERIIHACRGLPLVEVGGLRAGNLLSQRLSRLCPQLGPAADVRKQIGDVEFLREMAASSGMRFPRSHRRWPTTTAWHPPGRWLVKKRSSCGGLGVHWQDADSTIAADELLQQWVAGRSYGASLLSDGGDVVVLGACRSLFQRRGRLPFVYAGSFGPISLSPEVAHKLRRLGMQIVAATKLRGLFNVDYLLDREGNAWLIEINPRWSGSSEVIERRLVDRHALGVESSLFALSIQAIQGKNISLVSRQDLAESAETNPVFLKRIVFARADLCFRRSLLTQLSGLANGNDIHTAIHDVPREGTVIRQGEPMLTLISCFEHTAKNPMRKHQAVLRELHAAVERHLT